MIVFLTVFFSGGSGEERRQRWETLLHVQEPDENPEQEKQAAQKMNLHFLLHENNQSASKCFHTLHFSLLY